VLLGKIAGHRPGARRQESDATMRTDSQQVSISREFERVFSKEPKQTKLEYAVMKLLTSGRLPKTDAFVMAQGREHLPIRRVGCHEDRVFVAKTQCANARSGSERQGITKPVSAHDRRLHRPLVITARR